MNTAQNEISPVYDEPVPSYLAHHPAINKAFQDSQGPGALFQGGQKPDSPPLVMERPTMDNTTNRKLYQDMEPLVDAESDTKLQDVRSSEFEEIPPPDIKGPDPQRIWCYRCRTEQVTYTRTHLSRQNYLFCWGAAIVLGILSVLLFFPVLCLPLALVPLCVTSLMDVEHYCPKCDTLNGVYRRREAK